MDAEIKEEAFLKHYYKRVEEEKDEALKRFIITKEMFPTVQLSQFEPTVLFGIRDRLPDLTEEQVEEVAKLIGEYR